MGTLYLVATPIGNLEDMTPHGVRLLGEVHTVAAEDTRTAARLFRHFQISNRLLSYTEHNRRVRIPQLLRILESDDVALISEAGMPAVSDPGQELVAAAIEAGHRVSAAPGASALLTALTLSGFSTRQFVYLGFLPRQAGERRALLRSVAEQPRTLVCFEGPSRLRRSLEDILAALGDRRLAICRELTKLHEEILRLRASEAVALAQEPRGEYTLVIEGGDQLRRPPAHAEIQAALLELRASGLNAREATARLASELHIPRRRVYEEWLALPAPPGDSSRLC